MPPHMPHLRYGTDVRLNRLPDLHTISLHAIALPYSTANVAL
jgi:hypothetical protein